MLKLISWNVNGIRASHKKGFLDILAQINPDVMCLQETKAHHNQLPKELTDPQGYFTYWSEAERKGYSGTAVFTKVKPLNFYTGFGIKKFDAEGRICGLEFEDYNLLNIYFPNGAASEERLRFKLEFYDAFLKFATKLSAKKPLVVCGDVNTAHKEIDLSRPKANEGTSGFLPVERAWLDKFMLKFDDTFRLFNQDGENYTWWDVKTRSRERNVGWRLDYFLIDKKNSALVKDAFILLEVMGSDHCPVGIKLDIKK